jgi:hypothetical protein
MGSKTTSAFSLGMNIYGGKAGRKSYRNGCGCQKLIGMATILQLCILVIEHLGVSSRGFWLI